MPWHAPQADSSDPLAHLRNKLREVASGRTDSWAGIPMPLEDQQLVIEPGHNMAAQFNRKPKAEEGPRKIRNRWYSHGRRCDIAIIEEGGKITWGMMPAFHHLDHDLNTLGCSVAWGLEQESKALHLLESLVRPHTFKHYLLTGMFLETSEHSHVTYLFRRLKPTVAMVANKRGEMRILTTLCMHPIAYYEGTWAGAMCPTDDVIAHLMLMRAAEPTFWRRSNQHPAWRPEAGL